MSDNDITAYIKENPRAMGVLFTTMLLLSQAGSASASMGMSIF